MLTVELVLIVLVGAGVGAAGVLLIYALRPVEEKPHADEPSSLLPMLRAAGTRIPIAVGVALLTLVLTQWVVLAAAIGVLIFFAPALVGGAASEKAAIAKIEGLAAWTESLRDTIAGAVGLEQAIPATAYAAAPSVAGHLGVLADRLRVRTPLPVALQRFADDLDDASADLIVAALILNARLRGPGLRDVLSSLAESAREELEMRRRVSASRASTRRSVQLVIAITVLFVFGLAIFNRSYVEPYNTPLGQVVLLAILALFAAGFLWMRRLSAFDLPERFLRSAETTGQRG
ncbi:type II secretion system F family protein [Nocardioides massiliensis]|uniref:Flp pilus assembly protein TadB n=1 Tax=Nocardioides massiliensis TaxID=1325935 RepID=A0ABT9NJR5_9ACTN|nr:type II secretion system F family protein [Nocardioides massiliensis]MDP9820657.1 Flp pilus assembly protein TadB [Nocardioides massiliensis]